MAIGPEAASHNRARVPTAWGYSYRGGPLVGSILNNFKSSKIGGGQRLQKQPPSTIPTLGGCICYTFYQR